MTSASQVDQKAYQKEYTPKTRLGAVLRNPFGYDIVYLILSVFRLPLGLLKNPLVRLLPLRALKALAKGVIDDDFLAYFCEMLNAYNLKNAPKPARASGEWWRSAVGYQVYVRSFCDTNGDGVGDLPGVTQKLDYLKELGVDFIWLSPIFQSPNDDNGYDISDYRKIQPEFGTMADFTELVREASARDIRIVLDLVLNHTSDEHEWFKSASASRESPYRDYYIWRDPALDGSPPNNWHSIFSGSAWEYSEPTGQYYLHTYSRKMPDLNWKNPKVRESIYEMADWWCKQGVSGFRLDVINQIDKPDDFPSANVAIGELMGYIGCEYYFFGPRAHQYLNEFHERVFGPNETMTVGETPGTGLELSRLFTAESRKELSMVFNFDHLFLPGNGRFNEPENTLENIKRHLVRWQTRYGADCWNTLFYDNHDNPRMLSRIDDRPEFRKPLAKLLGMIEMTLCGTPFIYQGQELGMTNCDWQLGELCDIESINYYNENFAEHGAEKMLHTVSRGSRDNARTPIPWTGEADLGFSSAAPWIKPNPNYNTINANAQRKTSDSVFRFYKQLIALRRQNAGLIFGDFRLEEGGEGYFCYSRKYNSEKYYIELNISDRARKRKKSVEGWGLLLSNYGDAPQQRLRPYEANLYERIK